MHSKPKIYKLSMGKLIYKYLSYFLFQMALEKYIWNVNFNFFFLTNPAMCCKLLITGDCDNMYWIKSYKLQSFDNKFNKITQKKS